MFTDVETPSFSKLCGDYWTEPDRSTFAAWIASHPEAGDPVPGSGGCRKVRWSRPGMGKKGGVRVIYYNRLDIGCIFLLLIYAKSAKENIPANVLVKIKEIIDANE